MLLPFELAELPSCRLAVKTGGIFSDPLLLVDGKPIRAAKDGTFTVLGEDAAPVTISLLNRGLDLIPDVRVNDRTVVLMKPLRWFDYAWCLLPVLLFLVAIPGPLSGVLGAFVTYLNLRLFRTIRSPFAHYFVTVLVSVLTLAAYFWGSVIILSAVSPPNATQTPR
ncbi:MAG: hypothetical protein V4671_02455 [Armatimonadota bacterium]